MTGHQEPGLGPRFAAWRVLHDVRHGVPFDVALRRAIKDLESDDRRLAHELAAGVFRARTHLDSSLAGSIERGLESVRADTLDVLRLGAFQLLHLDKVPPHAAVQSTVGVARRLGGRKVAGFVNAVLRRIADGHADRIDPGGTEAGAALLAREFSHPEWLVARWLARFGPDETRALLVWNNTRPTLVIQPARWSRAQVETRLSDAGITFRPAPFDAGLIVSVKKPAEMPGYAEGAFVVQDPAQRLVTRFLAPDSGAVLYDACAAPGGKSIALAAGRSLVVAADRTRIRVRRLAENLKRAAPPTVVAVLADATRPPIRPVGAVLLDVPCLGTGTFARHPDARWRVTTEALQSLAYQAARFLIQTAEVVAPGGLLLFATCSLEPEENESQVARFLSEDRRFRREPSTNVPAELLNPDGDLVVLPQRHGTDGAYAARLRRIS